MKKIILLLTLLVFTTQLSIFAVPPRKVEKQVPKKEKAKKHEPKKESKEEQKEKKDNKAMTEDSDDSEHKSH